LTLTDKIDGEMFRPPSPQDKLIVKVFCQYCKWIAWWWWWRRRSTPFQKLKVYPRPMKNVSPVIDYCAHVVDIVS